MKILTTKSLTLLAIGLIAFSSVSLTKGPRGQFRYYWSDGRHGHHGLIKIGFNNYKSSNWSDNFFLPTKVQTIGRVSIDSDSIVLTPNQVTFYRRQDGDKGTTYKKIKCACDTNGLKAIDKEKEWYIIERCKPTKYFFNLDTLTEAKTEFKYIRQ